MDNPILLQTAKLTSILPAVFLSGYCYNASQNFVPKLFDQRPHISTPIFKGLFDSGGRVALPLFLLSSASSFLLVYAVPEKRTLWIIAAVLPLTLGLWTFVVMMPGVRRLVEISRCKGQLDKSEQTLEHRQLLKSWVWQNYVRSLFVLAAGGIGLWACI